MMRSPALDGRSDEGFGPVRRADLVEHVEDPARCTAVQGAGQGADRPDDRRPEVGPGRGDDPPGEGRGVEPVIDGQDHVLLDGPGVRGDGTSPVSM